jgi:hypothetical protein
MRAFYWIKTWRRSPSGLRRLAHCEATRGGGGMHRFAVLPYDIGDADSEYNCQARNSRWRVIKIWWREYVTLDMLREAFFFAKKEAKTLLYLVQVIATKALISKSFLVLFSKKEPLNPCLQKTPSS